MSNSLKKPVFEPIPVNHIRPLGWLKKQLEIQAGSLSGHLDEFWPDIKGSKWFGGDAEGWERAPYWLDGVIPLAYLLRDEELIEKVDRHMAYIISHQHEDGWLGPKADHYDLWGQFLILKVLTQYHDITGDKQALEAIRKNLKKIDQHINHNTLFSYGQARWMESLIAIYALYEKEPEQWLIDLAVKLQVQGVHWGDFFKRWPLKDKTPARQWSYLGHVVNNAMALKAHGLWYRLSGDKADRKTVYHMINQLDRYHGMVTGVFSGDECLAGLSPVQGTELCAVVEYLYSLEVLLSVLGDPAFADRLERIAFNALPATLSPDMWSHQYDQQVNQIECSIDLSRQWTTNEADSNIFGLEPHYGCCTANFSQGWPKFAAHLWMRTADSGLAACAYAPSEVSISVNNRLVKVSMETDYPFRDEIMIKISADDKIKFSLMLRIPGWVKKPEVRLNGKSAGRAISGQFFRLERVWSGTSEIRLKFPMAAEIIRRPGNTASIKRGPLIYSLKIGEQLKQINTDKPHRELPHADWEIYPTTPWNYALCLKNAQKDIRFVEKKTADFCFASGKAPVSAFVKGRRLNGWEKKYGSAGNIPTLDGNLEGEIEDLELIPYGCTNLRMTEFPVCR